MADMIDTKVGLTDKELVTVEVQFDEAEVLPAHANATNCLVGRLCAAKPPNSYYLMEVMTKAWRAKKDLTVREWGNNLFLFSFKNLADRDWVIRNQPWHFENHLFAVAPLHGNEQPSSVKLTYSSFWIRAYDLPIMSMSTSTVKAIAHRIGTLEEIDFTEPLLRGVMLQNGEQKVWIPLKYEALPIYCYHCGLIGHQTKNCDSKSTIDGNSFEDLRYGPWLKASPLKRNRPPSHRNSSFRSAIYGIPSNATTIPISSVSITNEDVPPVQPISPSSAIQPSNLILNAETITDLTVDPPSSNIPTDIPIPTPSQRAVYRPSHLRETLAVNTPPSNQCSTKFQLCPLLSILHHYLPHPSLKTPSLYPI
ncbi:hypothetical protein C2S52_011800 [Perilla frutescens var. hirtella]|nr:hypothetical protein C2S52_011800 [Perilla frutescens var. hirtella]